MAGTQAGTHGHLGPPGLRGRHPATRSPLTLTRGLSLPCRKERFHAVRNCFPPFAKPQAPDVTSMLHPTGTFIDVRTMAGTGAKPAAVGTSMLRRKGVSSASRWPPLAADRQMV